MLCAAVEGWSAGEVAMAGRGRMLGDEGGMGMGVRDAKRAVVRAQSWGASKTATGTRARVEDDRCRWAGGRPGRR